MDYLKQQKRHSYISWLNVLSAISVVVLHANNSFWSYRDHYTWEINNVVECIFYSAVPVFFMLTGVTLFDYTERYTTKTFLKKRFKKTFIPFLFWGLVAFFLKLIKDPANFFANELRFDKVFNGIFNANYFGIFWFFIPLFCIYLCLPLFASIQQEKKLKVLNYLACLALIVNIFAPFLVNLANILFRWGIEWKYSIFTLSEYLIFPVIGYLLHRYPLNKKQRAIIYAAALIGLGMHIFGTSFLSRKHGEIIQFFKGYLNLPCVLYSIGIFVFVKYSVNRISSEKLHRFISWFQGYTFAIYLLHMFIYDLIKVIIPHLFFYDYSPVFTVCMTVINIPICIFIAYILRKIPFIKSLVP